MAPSSGPPIGATSLNGLQKGSRLWYKKDANTWIPADLVVPPTKEGPGAVATIQPLSSSTEYLSNLKSGSSSNLAPVGRPVEVSCDLLAPANPALQDGIADVVQLSHLNEPGILFDLGYRYVNDDIYTWAGPVLIALNPCKTLPLYTPEVAAAYKQAARDSVTNLAPHIYLVAAAAFRQMVRQGVSQSLVVSGESGAGKTETTKKAMQYFATLAGGTGVEDQVLETNPILEAFGNAKTLRNHNSSRFGKLIQIHFNASHHICGAAIKTYLLEKSRVAVQLKGERSFHIFYQLVRGASPEERILHKLPDKVQDFAFLNQSGCHDISGVDDVQEFKAVRRALTDIGVPESSQQSLFGLLSGLLWLGNVEFEESSSGDSTKVRQTPALSNAAWLLGVSPEALITALTTRRIVAPGEVVIKLLKVPEAVEARTSLAKAIYAAIFNWIVAQINARLGSGKAMQAATAAGGGLYIAILDIYGFEQFDRNSFEQLCINYANERLQQQFTHHLFALEQSEYEREGIDWTKVEFVDNQACVDVFELMPPKGLGVLAVMDSQCKFPRASDSTLHTQLLEQLASHSHFGSNPRVPGSFVVRHYAGAVQYDSAGLLEKCKDTLSADLIQLMVESHSQLLAQLGTAISEESERSSKRGQTVITRFGIQLRELVALLDTTGLHFVRCIKPNTALQPNKLEPGPTLHQLRCCGVLEVARVAAAGFPTRYGHEEFAARYKLMLPVEEQKRLGQEGGAGCGLQACLALLQRFGLKPGQYQLGRTKVFFRPGVLGLIEDRWARMQSAALALQSYWRMYTMRVAYLDVRASAELLQSLWRARAARLAYSELMARHAAATVMQTAWRRAMARNHFQRVRWAVITIQTKGYRTWKFTRWLSKCLEARSHAELQAEEARVQAKLEMDWLGALKAEYHAGMDDVATALAAWKACREAGVESLEGLTTALDAWKQFTAEQEQRLQREAAGASSADETAAAAAVVGAAAAPAIADAVMAAGVSDGGGSTAATAEVTVVGQQQLSEGGAAPGKALPRASSGGASVTVPLPPPVMHMPPPPALAPGVVPRMPVMVMTPAVVTPAVVNRFELAQELAIQVERLNLENVKLQKQLHLERSLKERYQHKAEDRSVQWLDQVRLLQKYIRQCRQMFGDSQLPPMPKQLAAATQPEQQPDADAGEGVLPAAASAPAHLTVLIPDPSTQLPTAASASSVGGAPSAGGAAAAGAAAGVAVGVAAAGAQAPDGATAVTPTAAALPAPRAETRTSETQTMVLPEPSPAPEVPRPPTAHNGTQTAAPSTATAATMADEIPTFSAFAAAQQQARGRSASGAPGEGELVPLDSQSLGGMESMGSSVAGAAAQQHQARAPLPPMPPPQQPQNASQRYVATLGKELDRVMNVLPDDVSFIQEVASGATAAPDMDPGAELFKLKKKFELWKREFKEKLVTAEEVLRKIEHMEGKAASLSQSRSRRTNPNDHLQPSASVRLTSTPSAHHGPGMSMGTGSFGHGQPGLVRHGAGSSGGGGGTPLAAGAGMPGSPRTGARGPRPPGPLSTPPGSTNGDSEAGGSARKKAASGNKLLNKIFRT